MTRSYLGRHAISEREPADLAAMARRAWQERGTLVVHEDDSRLNDIERLMVRTLGEKVHGRRG
ncbi:MAG TPA: hypothetical protein VIK75_10305 [Calditerricola sp.]